MNKLGITDPDEMDDIELDLLDQLVDVVLETVEDDQMINSNDLCEWHRRWLANVYEWAGHYRSVNMGQGGFQFAAAHLVPGLMVELDKRYLSVYTPCLNMKEEALIEALAVVHVEFVLVHPFRDGNGRLSRVLANVMALQAGYPLLDFSYMDSNKNDYFAAIQTGLANYGPMKEMFKQVLRETNENASG